MLGNNYIKRTKQSVVDTNSTL